MKDPMNTLRNQSEQIAQIDKNLPSVFFQLEYENGHPHFLFISDNIVDILGYTMEDFNSNRLLYNELILDEDRSKMQHIFQKAVSRSKAVSLSFRMRSKSRMIKWIDLLVNVSLSKDGKEVYTGLANDISDEVELRDRIRLMEQRYKSLVNSASPAISTMSKNGYVLSVNPSLCELSGYSEKELLGKHFMKIPSFYVSDLPQYMSLFKLAIANKLPHDAVKFKWKHKNGDKRWGEAHLSPIILDDKKVGYQAVMVDITDRVKSEDKEIERRKDRDFLFEAAVDLLAIESEKELYDFLVEQTYKLIPDSIVAMISFSEDVKTFKVEAVKLAQKDVLNKAISLLGKRFLEEEIETNAEVFKINFSGRLDSYSEGFADIMRSFVPQQIGDRIQKLIKVDTINIISLNTRDRVLAAGVILLKKGVDIHHKELIETLYREASAALVRLKTKQKLNESEQLYRSLTESTDDWIGRIDRERRFVFVNQSILNAFNVEASDIIGKSSRVLVPSDKYNRILLDRLDATFRDKEKGRCEVELNIFGKTEFYEWNFFPELKGSTGEVETVLVTVRNITERKVEEGKLLEALSLKNKLFSVISHDLRSPYNSILGFLELLDMDYHNLSDEKRQEYISIIKRGMNDSLELLDSVLQWTKEYDSLEAIKPVYFNLKSVIDMAVQLNHAALLKRRIDLLINVHEEVMIYADYNMIYTVIRNLLYNAIKFSYDDGKVYINAEDRTSDIIFKIVDEGKGMNPGQIKKMLQGNQQVSTTGVDGQKGYGLGLKLSVDMIESNNGTLWIESEENKGTSVYFSVPKTR